MRDPEKAADGMESSLQLLYGIPLWLNVTENPCCPRHLLFAAFKHLAWFQTPSEYKKSHIQLVPQWVPQGGTGHWGSLEDTVAWKEVMEEKMLAGPIANVFATGPCIVWLEA